MFPPPRYRNSAGRLLAAIDELQKGGGQYQARLLQVAGVDPSSLRGHFFGEGQHLHAFGSQHLHAVSKEAWLILNPLRELYMEFLQDLEDSSLDQHDKFDIASGTKPIERFLFPTSLQQSINVLSPPERALLEMAARKLPQEGEVSPREIEAIRQQVEVLREMLLDSEISTTPKRILGDLIQTTEAAIHRYEFHGARGFKKAFEGMLGQLAGYYVSQEPAAREEIRESAWYQSALSLLQKVHAAASVANVYLPVAEPVIRRLLGLGD